MVSNIKLFFMVITAVISIGTPIFLAIIIVRKYKAKIWPIAAGAAVFFVFQIMLRIPLLNQLGTHFWYQNLLKNNYIIISLILGLSAGLFEEAGRFIGYKVLIKKKNYSYENGIAFGIGHGGIESILLVGSAYINDIIMSVLINNGSLEKVFGTSFSSEALILAKSQLTDTNSYIFLLGGVERLFTIAIQIVFSLIILYSVKYKKYQYVLLAILLHTLVDTPVSIMTYYGVSVFLMEGYIFIWAIASVIFIIKGRKYFVDKERNEINY